MSKFTISRITFAIKRFQEQESKRIFILREWPAMEWIAGEAEKNLSVDAYMSPPILIFDVLTCYGGVMNPLCCPVCLKSGQSSNLRPTGLWTDGTTRCRVRTLFGTKNSRTFQGHSRAQFQFFKHSIL